MMPVPGTRILLMDSSAYRPSSPLFAEALDDLAAEHGYRSHFLDEAEFFREPRTLRGRLIRRAAGHPLTVGAFNRAFARLADGFRPDVAIVVKGTYVEPATLLRLRAKGVVLVNFVTDDPFSEPATRTPLVRAVIPHYDLYCSPKRAIVADLLRAGARRVEFLPCGYKPSVHFPEAANPGERERFSSDVSFIGGADEDRLPYFVALLQALPDIRLHLYGGYWDRYPALRTYARGHVLGRDFRLALAETKIAVNLVRRKNRDGHVMRSFELPACKAFMLAERTDEHAEFLDEDREMACFNSEEEFVEKIALCLDDADRRRQIAEAGYARIVGGRNTWADRLTTLLEMAAPIIEKRI